MKIKEILEKYEDKAVDVEFYLKRKRDNLHTDSIRFIDTPLFLDIEADWELLDEESYNNTILANCGEVADYAAWYGGNGKEDKVLVIMLDPSIRYMLVTVSNDRYEEYLGEEENEAIEKAKILWAKTSEYDKRRYREAYVSTFRFNVEGIPVEEEYVCGIK